MQLYDGTASNNLESAIWRGCSSDFASPKAPAPLIGGGLISLGAKSSTPPPMPGCAGNYTCVFRSSGFADELGSPITGEKGSACPGRTRVWRLNSALHGSTSERRGQRPRPTGYDSVACPAVEARADRPKSEPLEAPALFECVAATVPAGPESFRGWCPRGDSNPHGGLTLQRILSPLRLPFRHSGRASDVRMIRRRQ